MSTVAAFTVCIEKSLALEVAYCVFQSSPLWSKIGFKKILCSGLLSKTRLFFKGRQIIVASL